MLDGWTARFKRNQRQDAWKVASLCNATGNMKEPVTIDSLLGHGPDGLPMDMHKIRLRAEERRRERLAARGAK